MCDRRTCLPAPFCDYVLCGPDLGLPLTKLAVSAEILVSRRGYQRRFGESQLAAYQQTTRCHLLPLPAAALRSAAV